MNEKNFHIIGIHNTGVLSSACLVSNGLIKFASTEEKLSKVDLFRLKQFLIYLKHKLDVKDIDHFAIGWNPGEILA